MAKGRNVTGKPLEFQALLDNSKLKKSVAEALKELRKLHDLNGGRTSNTPALTTELKIREQVIKSIERQKIKQEELNKAIQAQRKPAFTAADTAAEIAAAQRARTGNGATGTVTNAENIKRAAEANAALAISTNNATQAQVKQTIATRAQEAAQKAQIASLDQLQIRLQSYKNIAAASTDPARLEAYNKKIQQTEIQIAQMSNVGKEGFDKMGNAIKGSTNMVSKAISGIFRLAYLLPGIGVAGLLAFAIDPIINYIKQLDLFKKKVDEAKRSKEELAAVSLKGEQDAQAELITLRMLYKQYQDTNLPLKERKNAYDQMQKMYPDYFKNLKFENTASDATKAAYDRLTTSILATARARAALDKMTENSRRQLDDEQKIRDIQAENEKKAVELRKAQELDRQANSVQNTGTTGAGLGNIVTGQDVLRIQNEIKDNEKAINDLKTDRNILTERNLNLEKEVTKEVQKGGKIVDTETGGGTKNLAKEISQREHLLQKISDLEAEYSRKSLEDDEAEIRAVRDKFKRILTEVQNFNQKTKSLKVDTSGLEGVREKAIADLRYKQDTEKLKIELEEQKRIFEDYENFKTDFGEEKANERYANELKGFSKYSDYLKSKMAVIMASSFGIPTAAEKDRFNAVAQALGNALDEEQKKRNAAFKAALEASETFELRRVAIIDKYLKLEEDLRAQSSVKDLGGRLKKLQEDKEAELQALREESAQKTGIYKRLNQDIYNFTRERIKKEIKELERLLDADKSLSAVQIAEIKRRKDQLKSVYNESNQFADNFNRVSADLSEISNSFGELAAAVGDLNPGLAETLNTLGQLTKAGSDAAGAVSSFMTGDIVGGIGKAIGAITGIFKIFTASRESARKAAAEMRKHQEDLIKNEITYNQEMRERVRNQQDITDLTKEELAARKAMLNTQGQQSQSDYDRLLSLIRQQGQQITGYRTEKYGGFLGIGRKTRVVEQTAGLQGLTYEEIEKLDIEGKLTGPTKEWFDELKKAHDEVVGIKDDAEELARTIVDKLTAGLSSNKISDMIIEGFRNGKLAVEDFADDVEDLVREGLLSALAYQTLEGPLKKAVEQMRKDVDSDGDGISDWTNEERERFKAEINGIIKTGIEAKKAVEEASGISLTKPGQVDKPTSQAGQGVARASQDSVDVLTGQLMGMRVAQLEGNEIMRNSAASQVQLLNAHLDQLIAIERNTGATARNTIELKRLEAIEASLKNIDRTLTVSGGAAAANGRGF